MHDDEQIGRLYDLDLALKAGHIPPRIVPNLGFGYGYPFYNFYPPFAYYVGEAFHLVGFSLIVSTKLMVATGFLLSAFFMYLFSKEFFGKLGGLLSAIAYTLLSYKAVDVYVRGAYAEFFAFVPIPLIFISILKIQKEKMSWFIGLNSIAVAMLVLSHNLIALMSTPFIGIWILYNFYISKKKKRYFLEILMSFLLGFGLSAYFFIPSYLERGYTLVNILTTELANYSLHFVCAYQLWDSMWGYGGSIASCFDGVSFEVGKVQLVTSFIVFVFAIYKLAKRAKEKNLYISIGIIFFMLLASLFFMVKYSKPFWDIFPPFWYIQFPWRFLIFSGFFGSFLTGGIIILFKNKTARMIVFFAIILLLFFFSNGKFVPQRQFPATDEDYTNKEKIRFETSNLAYEYVPKGIKTKMSDIQTTKIDIEKSEIASIPGKIISGTMSMKTLENKPQYKKYSVVVEESGIFQINTFSFPGWVVYKNGKKVDFDDQNDFKLIRIMLEKGEYEIEAKFQDTPARTYGNIASILSIIGLFALFIITLKFKLHYEKN